MICTESPEKVAEEIASFERIGDFLLLKTEPLNMRDVYLDQSGGKLQVERLALRIRTIGDRTWVALKGPGRIIQDGVIDRMELEESWSPGAIEAIVKKLGRIGISLPDSFYFSQEGKPVEVMAALGFAQIQDRETTRRVRNVVLRDNKEEVLAELAVDLVHYHLQGRDVRHYEVEIEEKGVAGTSVLAVVSGKLFAKWGNALRKWNYSKLATGFALEALESQGALEDLIGSNDNLTPEAYDKLEEWLIKVGRPVLA